MPQTIEVPRGWLEGLITIKNKITNAKDKSDLKHWQKYLVGYIESAKAFLNK